ncbi:MAG: hypothetical protein SGPRY_012543, partial [Prymnesium sp.]
MESLLPPHLQPTAWSEPTELSLSRFSQFTSSLTSLLNHTDGIPLRAVLASTTPAVVYSEGQGYGLFLSASLLSSLPSTHPRREEVRSVAVQLYLGWRRMCERSSVFTGCQEGALCGGRHACLPSWKFDSRLEQEISTGSASDGDEDGIVGLILLLLATEHDSPPMRDFMSTFAPTWGTHGDEGRLLAPRWASLIHTSFHIVSDSQCRASGLIPNWFVPSQSPLPTAGTAGCSGSGTPAAQFGSEASRSAWRMGVAWLWYADERAANICQRLARHAAGALASYKLGSCDHADSCAGVQLPLELSSPLPSVPPMPPPITHPLMPPPLMPPHTSTLPP